MLPIAQGIEGPLTAEPDRCLINNSGDWYVIHTHSRQEKALARDLLKLDVKHFLPLNRLVRYYGKRRFVVDEPLFPSYVFVKGKREEAFRVDRSPRVVRIIETVSQAQLSHELRQLQIAVDARLKFDSYPTLRLGARVVVRAGPLRGLEGMVESRSRLHMVVLQVQTLGQAVSVEVDSSLVDVLDEWDVN
jgi:transcription antitermination factor NusG